MTKQFALVVQSTEPDGAGGVETYVPAVYGPFPMAVVTDAQATIRALIADKDTTVTVVELLPLP